MKKILKALFLVSALPLLFGACDNNEGLNSTATPVVKYIRPTDPATAENYLTSASMGDVIAIIGEGLEGVRSVRFNDVEAKLNPTFISSNAVVVTVPSTLPTEITNTITLTTQKGRSCTVENFVTMAPAPSIASVSLEWANPGDPITIFGNYFFAKSDGSQPEVLIGGQPATIASFTNTQITATVPAGIDQSVPQRILVTNDYGTGRSSFYLYDSSDLFVDFEELSWDWWGYAADQVLTQGGVANTYLNFNGVSKDWNWDDKKLAFFYCNVLDNGSVVNEIFPADEDPANYSLKFEVRIKAWSDLYMTLWFTGDYNTFSVDNDDAQCHWKGYAEPALKDGQWHTVSIPLTDFNTNKEGSETRKLMAGDIKNFCIFFFGSLENAANADAPLDIDMDNFRLVKTK